MGSDSFDPRRDLGIPFIAGESDFGWSQHLRSVMTAVTQNDKPWARLVVDTMDDHELAEELLRAVVMLRSMWIHNEMETLKLVSEDGTEQGACQVFDDSWPSISVHLATMWENGESLEQIDPPDPA